jgi:hypothetical protein
MTTPLSPGQEPEGRGVVSRLRAVWRRVVGQPLSPEQARALELQRNRADAEVDRMNAHRHSGRFTNGTGF